MAGNGTAKRRWKNKYQALYSESSLRKNHLVHSVYITSEKVVPLAGVELIKFARLPFEIGYSARVYRR